MRQRLLTLLLLGALAVLNIRAAEVYTHFDPETGVLMYYYDDLRTSCGGTNELYNPDTERFKTCYNLITKAVIHSSMKNAPLTSMRNMFYGGNMYRELYNMTTIEGLENLNTANVTDMSQMFSGCGRLTSIDFSSFNTAKVTNMYRMFSDCSALTSLDLSSFNTANVTTMESMFQSCRALISLDLSSFDIAKVTDMSGMFMHCYVLKTIYCDIDWSTSTVLTNSSQMFSSCELLIGSKGTTYNSAKIDKSYAHPDGGTSKPGNFRPSSDKSKEVYTHFNSSTGVVTYYYDSQRASRGGTTETYDPDQGDPLHFTSYNHGILKAVIDPSMKYAPLTSMRNMFACGNGYFLSQMTSIEGLENLNTAVVRDMSQMFYGCSKLTSLDLSSFNTANVTTMESMFQSCGKLTTLDLSSFNTDRVKTMSSMFRSCESLTSIDISSFTYYSLTNTLGMFYGCKQLKTIYSDTDWSYADFSTSYHLTSFNTDNMFYNCTSLVGGKGTTFNSSKTNYEYARPDGGTSSPGYFTSSSDKPVVFTQYGSNTLTYYYGNMAAHSGYNKELYDPTSSEKRFVSYSENIRKVVIDESMKDALLTSTVGMFWGGTDQELINLTSIEGLENLNTANVTNMNSMFNRCKRLETLDLSTFDVSKVEYASYMFRGCESLTTIYCDNDWSTSTVMTQSYGMFQDCTSLVGGKGTVFDSSVHYSLQDKRYARPDGGTSKPGYFTSTTSSGILPTVNDNLNVNDSYYTLDGRKLQGKPTQTGVYIRNGRKVLIK